MGFVITLAGHFYYGVIFMNQPISFPANLPNETTVAAMEAARRGEVEHFATLEELLKALDVVDKK